MTVTAWGWQVVCQLRRCLPDRGLVVVAAGTFATYELLGGAVRLARPVTVIPGSDPFEQHQTG